MSVNLNNFSIVSWIEGTEKHKCGYCKSGNGSITNGMWAEQLTVEDYQDLIDRGWRRCGKYCYKPIMNETCCPQYTIRCDALNISLSKSQKKIIKKLNKFLENGVLSEKDIPTEGSDINYEAQPEVLNKFEPKIIFQDIKVNKNELINEEEVRSFHGTGEPCSTISNDPTPKELVTNPDKFKETNYSKSFKKGLGPDGSKLPCKKAKILRIERKKEKLNKLGLRFEDIAKKKPGEKTIEEFVENIGQNSKCKLKIYIFSCNELSQHKLDEEYQLYKKYQMRVHDDPPEKFSFKRFKSFLVTSPLQPKDFPNGDGPGFGSFHQQYWIDDKLIAVGVIDILPKCVSSVYFFYDPDYRSLCLGTYSSLREVYFTRSLQRDVPELRFYYMGFYIHSCPKMRYKGKLVPSYLVCPETYCWIPIEKCIPLLDVNKYSRLNDDINATDNNIPTNEHLLKTKIVYNHQFMSFISFKKLSTTANGLFTQIGILVGNICLNNMVFWIQ